MGIVGDLEAHRDPLERLGGGGRVVLQQRPHARRELRRIAKRVKAHERQPADAGLELDDELVRFLSERGVTEGRQIRVFFGTEHNREQRGNARLADETAQRTAIELTRHQPVGPQDIERRLHVP